MYSVKKLPNGLIPFLYPGSTIYLKFNYQFFEALLVSGLINITSTILYHRALFKGDISVVIPLLSFTPLFLLFLSPLIVGEFPDTWGLIEKGTRYMMIVAFIWAISANFDKRGLEASSIYQYVFFINLVVTLGTTIFVFSKRKISLPALKAEYKNLLAVGLLTSAVFFVHMTAITLTLVVYVVSIKRTGGMISVFLGYFIFKEKNIRQRFLGSAIMFAGVLLIVLL
ncbi:MAG: EamA family transporter [Ignavibacteriaceae bacterium]